MKFDISSGERRGLIVLSAIIAMIALYAYFCRSCISHDAIYTASESATGVVCSYDTLAGCSLDACDSVNPDDHDGRAKSRSRQAKPAGVQTSARSPLDEQLQH